MSSASSGQSNHSLRSKGSIDLTKIPSLEKSSRRKLPAKWTDEEERALVLYLKAQLPADGPNFVKKHFNGVAQHLQEKFLSQQGGEKNGAACQTKWTSLKEEYLAVLDLKAASGFTWSDETGAGREKTDPVWKDYHKSHKRAGRFRNKGFHLFDLMAEMMPSKGKGAHVFRPGSKRCGAKSLPRLSHPVPSSEPSTSSTVPTSAIATTSQALPPEPSSTSSPALDVAAPPSAPSSFLQPSECGSNNSSGALTSVSRGKCKVSALSGSGSVASGAPGSSDLSRKRVRAGPSVQAEHMAESMKRLTSTIEEMSKNLAASSITTNNDVWQRAITVLNTHRNDFPSVNDFLDAGRFLTDPANKQHALLFTGLENPMDRKQLLESYLEGMRKDQGTSAV